MYQLFDLYMGPGETSAGCSALMHALCSTCFNSCMVDGGAWLCQAVAAVYVHKLLLLFCGSGLCPQNY
jgi:hypothetical protein